MAKDISLMDKVDAKKLAKIREFIKRLMGEENRAAAMSDQDIKDQLH